MTEERLQLLPKKFLTNIAQKEGIKVSKNIDKQDLIDLIIEAIEEDRNDNRILDNPVMKIKEKKFDITLDEQYYFNDDKYPLPEKYHETKIVLLLRDPAWAFVYWEINKSDMPDDKEKIKEFNFLLRVYELKQPEVNKENIIKYVDVPVTFSDTSWYINLFTLGVYYCVDLIVEENGIERSLCKSNIIKSPNWEISDNIDFKDFRGLGNDLMLVASIYGLNPSESEGKIQQRIISLIDSENLE